MAPTDLSLAWLPYRQRVLSWRLQATLVCRLPDEGPFGGPLMEANMSAGSETEVVEIDLVEIDITVEPEERDRRRRKAYTVIVKAPAGFEARFRVHPQERVETLARHAITHFTSRSELAAGDYVLEKIEAGTTVPLTPSASLADSGVGPDTVCALVVAGPQVDG
jgi:hypothetical protein